MIFADYNCGCTFIGHRKDYLSYCSKHGDSRRKRSIFRIPKSYEPPEDECGFDWQLNKRGKKS